MSAERSRVFDAFQHAVGKPQKSCAKKPKPFSLRLSAEERAWLEEQAGSRALGAYIREKLFGENSTKRRTSRRPPLSDGQYAALLAALGESRLSSNLNQLAKHANMGTLDISDDAEKQLEEAYQAILEMRKALIMALNLKIRG